ncbi:hypothetical protein [Streptomyces sp. f150]|uniref:hypothetical protein n=1 Tax=Streptomyces sp. f150 TaxID=1827699 RepID=UPI000BEFE612|nr:hypothetical protein [Streptomyces sp. f150]
MGGFAYVYAEHSVVNLRLSRSRHELDEMGATLARTRDTRHQSYRVSVDLTDETSLEKALQLAHGLRPDLNRPGAAVGAIAGQRDRVPVQDTVLVMVLAHPERGVAQPGEEVGRAGNGGGGLADGALEALPGSFRETAAGQPSPAPP